MQTLVSGLICLLVRAGGLVIQAVVTLDDQVPGGKLMVDSVELDPTPAQLNN